MSALQSDPPIPSSRPYLIRALYEWCADNGMTPHIAVLVDQTVQVPREHVQDGHIVLNISADATGGLVLDNDYISFKARFGGVPRDIIIPVNRVVAIYARENGQGMAFPVPEPKPKPETSGQAPAITPVPGSDNPYVVAQARLGPPLPEDTSGPPGIPRGRGIRLVSTTPAAPEDGADHDPPPSPPAAPRPALKRVK
jgi:stringent starvation protein B